MSQLQNYQRKLYQRRFIQDCFFAFSLENDRGLPGDENDPPLNMVCEHDAFIHVSSVILLASNVEHDYRKAEKAIVCLLGSNTVAYSKM